MDGIQTMDIWVHNAVGLGHLRVMICRNIFSLIFLPIPKLNGCKVYMVMQVFWR